jgi:hypothetical protein
VIRATLLTLAVAGMALAVPDDSKPPAAEKAEARKAPETKGPAVSKYKFAAPVRLEAGGKPIDTAVGHAHPLVVDFDGDGVNDLLVGQFGDGILWVYKNTGTNKEPKYAAGVQFKEGTKDGRVPTG